MVIVIVFLTFFFFNYFIFLLDEQKRIKTPEIMVTSDSIENCSDNFIKPIVTICVESPKDPPSGDFAINMDYHDLESNQLKMNESIEIQIDEPIDVNEERDTTNIFYDYQEEEQLIDKDECKVVETTEDDENSS